MTSKEVRERVARVLAFLAALYPRFELTKATIDAYGQVLADIAPDMLEAAVALVGGRSTFFPAAAEIRAAAFEILEASERLPTAYEAWEEVLHQLRLSWPGQSRQPVFSHPLIEQAVRAVGDWVYLCNSQNPTADRARFLEGYRELVERWRRDRRMLPQVRHFTEQLADRKAAPELPDPGPVREAIEGTAHLLRAGGDSLLKNGAD